jgi:hypothetical protein
MVDRACYEFQIIRTTSQKYSLTKPTPLHASLHHTHPFGRCACGTWARTSAPGCWATRSTDPRTASRRCRSHPTDLWWPLPLWTRYLLHLVHTTIIPLSYHYHTTIILLSCLSGQGTAVHHSHLSHRLPLSPLLHSVPLKYLSVTYLSVRSSGCGMSRRNG